jgi:hypothetical protein
MVRPLSSAARRHGVNRARRDTLFLSEKARTEQVDLKDAVRPYVDERNLLDDFARLPVSAQSETPAEAVSTPDLYAMRVQNLEVRGAREPAFETPCNLLAPRAYLGSSRQEHPRLRFRCQGLSESSKVAR